MDILKVAILSLVSVFVLFILTKIMGNREMSQLSMFDYIVSITIGSIAAEMSTALENDFMQPLVAMIIYALVTFVVSIIGSKSLKFRRIIEGKSLILFDNGKLYRNNFKKGKLDINEFLMQCRTNGYFNLSDLQTAILEANGKISFLPTSSKKPLTPSDMNLNISTDKLVTNIVLDGKLLKKNLYSTGNDEIWFEKQLHSQGFDINDVFLATCDLTNNLSIYKKFDIENSSDFFE